MAKAKEAPKKRGPGRPRKYGVKEKAVEKSVEGRLKKGPSLLSYLGMEAPTEDLRDSVGLLMHLSVQDLEKIHRNENAPILLRQMAYSLQDSFVKGSSAFALSVLKIIGDRIDKREQNGIMKSGLLLRQQELGLNERESEEIGELRIVHQVPEGDKGAIKPGKGGSVE